MSRGCVEPSVSVAALFNFADYEYKVYCSMEALQFQLSKTVVYFRVFQTMQFVAVLKLQHGQTTRSTTIAAEEPGSHYFSYQFCKTVQFF